ncbi:Xaa-Pro aminopeptidase [Entomomonas asaccharolytica]|uniref:Xaa-Pro aminopeptidase n=1 Tax=Entomomonas asaccharolytica TaxID=2785331 RepID=A0A974NDP1_9GAMM|nr:Xaa-Pro aminopeptidase [Entomomonas asaccharolytica]QQP84608.1 Xaa-Pro aminopeptidase [Entomomonas asaccharolytica]
MITIAATEYQQRRQRLLAELDANGIAVIAAAAIVERNEGVEYPYRQDSNFQYLTGFPEPEALLVLVPNRAEGQVILFCRDRDPLLEVWTGIRAGQEGAIKNYGVDQAFSIKQLDEIMPTLLDGRSKVYSLIATQHDVQQQLRKWVEVVRSRAKQDAVAPTTFKALEPILHEMRLHKSEAELAVMQYAMDISAKAHIRAMQESKAGLYEYSLEAALEYEFRRGGARLVAYNSIVASGSNACILHYQDNNAQLKAGDLVMIDAGCEVDCYASDISRTFPVTGKFSAEQKALYEIVLAANMAAIGEVAPNKPYQAPHDIAVKIITEGLVELGILQGNVETLIANKAYTEFYMHSTGHWLGLDVHDVGAYRINKQSRPFEAGMVLTIEPGIYIAPDNTKVAEKWRGIGIRIEDNVVVTEQGHRVMTANAPKTIAEIESLMAC